MTATTSQGDLVLSTLAEHRVVFRVEHRETGLGPYHFDTPFLPMGGNDTQCLPHQDERLMSNFSDVNSWWQRGLKSAFGSALDLFRWFSTQREWWALRDNEFVVRIYRVPEHLAAYDGDTQVLLAPDAVEPGKAVAEFEVLDLFVAIPTHVRRAAMIG